MRSKFITFEGIDGSGKSTIATMVARHLEEEGNEVVLTTEPTKSWLGEAVKKSYDDDVGPLAETFLFLADRAYHSLEIRGWIGEGKVVISDRYADSTFAYQGPRLEGVMRDPMRWLRAVSRPAILEPDLTILLKIEPSLGLSRIAGRKRKVKFEELQFLEKVAHNYDLLSKVKRFAIVNASLPPEQVMKRALEVIHNRLGQ